MFKHTPDCTTKCQSTQHGECLTSAITKRSISDNDLCSYLTYTCCCCESVRDQDGRTTLHVAASCGRTDLVTWLVEICRANINARDRESMYTPLHRSVFYGKIDTAVELIKLDANMSLQDANALTPLEHVMMDRFRPPHSSMAVGELFTWGTNSNNSLGSQQPRAVPESMDIFHKQYPNENVSKILIDQFHSVILTESGSVYSCGHGQGGRLGLGIQHTEVVPKLLSFPASVSQSVEPFKIISCSIARDHSIFLSANKELFSCGLNKHRVLGIAPPPVELLVPKLFKHLTDEVTTQVASGNYHSLFWNELGIFSWGLNAGQLGHQFINVSDDKYILTPKRVKAINLTDNSIRLVATSTGATVVYTRKNDIYALHEYQCRKIASRQLNLTEITVIGGKLNHTLDPELSNKTRELKIAALTSTGNVLLWQESDPVLRRCIFSISRALNVTKLALNDAQMVFVTEDGEAFRGVAKPRKKKGVGQDVKSGVVKNDFHKFVEKDECVGVKLERIPRVHRAVSIQSDPKGQNFGIVQERPYKYFSHCSIAPSSMFDDMAQLLATASADDDIADIEFRVSGRSFAAHKYILASRSHYFLTVFEKSRERVMELQGYNATIFEQLLKYIYTGTTELIEPGEIKNESLLRLCLKPVENGKENITNIDENAAAYKYYKVTKPDNSERKLDNPVRMLHEMAKRFEVIELQKILSNLEMVKNLVRVKKTGREVKRMPLIFNKNICAKLYDIEIVCRDQRSLKAHKCILASRLDYFESMFSSRWNGASTSQISMPFSKGVVEALLEFIYTDSLDRLEDRDIDQLFKIIVLADQFFVTRLKNQCENILSDMLTIKNAVQLLIFADAYNADSLKTNCFEFIQQNMTSFLELRLLDDLESPLLKELSEFYQEKRGLDCRVITPYSTAVSDEEITRISSAFPVDIAEKREKPKPKASSASKKRSRTHRTSSSSEKAILSTSLENDSQFSQPLHLTATPDNSITKRLNAIVLATGHTKTDDDFDGNFTNLTKNRSFVDSYEFPLLNSPPKSDEVHARAYLKGEFRQKAVKLSQKQRKRLSSGSQVDVPIVAESPKNPWKILQDPVSPVNSPINDNMGSIMSSERKQRDNLVKITSKQLVFTQMEDKAIEDLRRFYNVDNIEEEIILIERVSVGAVAIPFWVAKTK